MGNNTGDIKSYIEEIKKIDPKKASEASYRTALENLLNSFDIAGRDITVIQEPKDEPVDGIPDFSIYESERTLFKKLIGFIECKKTAINIDNLASSEQIQKYAKTADNIIITNYKKFTLLQKRGGIVKAELSVVLLNDDLKPAKNIKHLAEELKRFYLEFIKYEYPYIHTKKLLIEELARQSFYFSVKLREELTGGNKVFSKSLNALFEGYSQTLHYGYTKEEFCDIYAQSFIYALLISRLENPDLKYDEVDNNYTKHIPKNYIILQEFLEGIGAVHKPLNLKIASWQVAKFLNLIDIPKIQDEFEQADDGRDSIIVYLYEDFLKKFDELQVGKSRKENGVYYTPKAVVNFIVRNVNFLIKEKLGKASGFSEKSVKILDFATGTGSFLASTIHEMAQSIEDDLDKKEFKDKILTDVYGFELQFTPYIVAHIVLTKILKNYDVKLKGEERLGVYIANTLDLENASTEKLYHLSEETEKVESIKKEEKILAIMGNPPYNSAGGHNNSKEMTDLMKHYKENLGITRVNLEDLYIQFIRFAEHKIEQHKEGVVGIITNNSFLDGFAHWRMRKHLYETFDEIYILNLHGNTWKKDPNKNVFDIRVGVCISFFVKRKINTEKKVYYYSILESNCLTRSEEFDFLDRHNIDNISWDELQVNPEKPLFVRFDYSGQEHYEKFWKLSSIFSHYTSGASGLRDVVCISYSKEEQEKIIHDFKTLEEHEIRKKYLPTQIDSRDWKLDKVIDDIKRNDRVENYRLIHYRPFDVRWTFNSMENKGFFAVPQKRIAQQMKDGNIALVFPMAVGKSFRHALVSRYMGEYAITAASPKPRIAPLYIFEDGNGNGDKVMNFGGNAKTNFTREFSKFISDLSFSPTPEEILAYIYCILYSPIYLGKYGEFLKRDCPAIPLTESENIFYKYAKIGQKLIDIHLLEKKLKDSTIKVKLSCKGDFVIEKQPIGPSGANDTMQLYGKNSDIITFEGVSEDIYKYKIGDYEVISKWLSYRKKHQKPLKTEDITHLKNIVIAIKQTIELEKEIEALGEAYLD